MDDYTDMIGETPPLVEGDTLELAELGGPGAELSTGLILTWRDKLVFAVERNASPLGAPGRRDVAAFVGIGGHLDHGEGWNEAVVREALEEANCTVALGDSAVTYMCQPGSAPHPIAYRWSEACRPLLVWVAVFDLRRGPLGHRVPVTLVNAVFRAAALHRPSPGAEISSLLMLDQELLVDTCREPRSLAELQTRGAELVGQALSPDTLLAPGGSAYFYARWLAWQEDR